MSAKVEVVMNAETPNGQTNERRQQALRSADG